jgi:predicted HAD superfamily phosphohydrolase YqeG
MNARIVTIFVDVDDTFVRSFGTKRIPMPAVIAHIRSLHAEGAKLYCWSSGGAEYAKESADEFGIAECFSAFLPKPDILLDDQSLADWRRLAAVHPNECVSMSMADYRAKIERDPR